MAERFREGTESAAQTPIVIVVSSLAGGTGAGIIVDVCDLLRSRGERWLDDSIGIFYSADVFSELSQNATEGVQPNSAAAFSEILHGYYGGGGFTAPGGGPVQQRSGPAFPYLVGQSNTQGVNFGDQLEVYRFMGRCLAAVMSDLKIQDDFASYMVTNWQASAGQFQQTDEAVGLLAEPPGYGGAFQALGFAEVELGVERLGVYAERRVARDAVEWALTGHRSLIAERSELSNLSEEERIDWLAEGSFTRFLNGCRINERGKENNQMLDAIGLPENRLRADLNGHLETIWEACSDALAGKARSQEWIQSIVDEVNARRHDILEQWDIDLRRSVAEWTKKAQRLIPGKVGNFIGESGMSVTEELIRRAESEMEAVSGELVDESHDEDRLSRNLRSDVESVLRTGGTLREANPVIRQAIGQGLNTGVVHSYQSKLCLLVSQLVEDFREDYLRPLRIAIGEAREELQEETEGDPDTRIGSSLTDWPRHSPDSDQAVPDGLIPGQSVKALLDPDDFVMLFKTLTAQSVSASAEREQPQLQVVRKQSLLGESSNEWIEQTDDWHPRDELVLGEYPKNRASFRIHLGVDDVVRRARGWLRTEGSAWSDFLSQGIRSYLSESPTVSPSELARRERRFRRQLEAAFESAEPLASVDLGLLSVVHPATDWAVRPVPGEIPVAGLPVEERIAETLTVKFGGDREKANRCLTQSDHPTKIPIYSSLSSAFHPIVFDSLMHPIADKFKRAETLSMVPNFWKWRRARTLKGSAPIPASTLLALLRGWFTARLLGAVEIGDRGVRLHSEQGVVEFPKLLQGGSRSSQEVLADLVDSLAIALPMTAKLRQFDRYLGPYKQLVEWGREPGTVSSGLSGYQVPSLMLSRWLDTGETPAGRNAMAHGANREERAHKVVSLLIRTIEAYKKEYQTATDQDQTAHRSWLGLQEQIIEALTQMEKCVKGQTASEQLL